METTYERRRGEIQTYFDRTALDAWKRFATGAPLGRIRATVREGRARMRAQMLAALPSDLTGWRILDAGCGAGAMSAVLAGRGADVLGVDLSPELIRFAGETLPADLGAGRVRFVAGDMLSPEHGEFDAVMAMDSLIHYQEEDAAIAIAALAARTRRRLIVTFAPRTPALAAMHAVGTLFPRANKAPAIVPVRPEALRQKLFSMPALEGWTIGASQRILHGFYTSQSLELSR